MRKISKNIFGGFVMRKYVYFMFLTLILCIVLAACGSGGKTSSEAEKSGSKEPEKTEETKIEDQGESEKQDSESAFEVATSIEEIIEQGAGEYAGTAYNKAVVHRALDENSFQDKDSFQVYSHLLSLMSEADQFKEYYDFTKNFNPEIETVLSETPGGMTLDDGQQVSGTANIAILLDSSGSMAQKVGGKSKMEQAKEAINQFVASMPEEANISLRVYGHEGSNADSDKELSCKSTEMVYDLKPYKKAEFEESLNQFQPTGWTPIAKSIAETKKDFENMDSNSQNIIYIVSDGVETCDGDPVQEAKKLHDSNIKAVVNIIGFDVNSEGQKQLLEVAKAGGGNFETVNSADDFKRVWEKERVRLYNEWSSWRARNFNDVSREQTDKKNELYGKRTDFMNLTYDEESRLKEAVTYLNNNEQISDEVKSEVRSMIEQRQDILAKLKEEYNALIETVDEGGDNLKDAIKEKGDEMKDKYGR
jgi:Ca-activated chloride channel homolog